MMSSMFPGHNVAGVPSEGYSNDAILADLSRQIASATSRRLSRGSNSHRPGGAMRIVKPSSASNSPLSSMQARRRILMGHGLSPPQNQQYIPAEYIPTPGSDMTTMTANGGKAAGRPVSWHPSSHLSQTQMPPQSATPYPLPTYGETDFLSHYQQFPPTPAAYSNYASPAAFSPLSLPSSTMDSQQYFSPTNWAAATTAPISQTVCSPVGFPALGESYPTAASQRSSATSESSSEWNSFIMHGFNRCSAPPTPADFAPAERVEPKLSPEESIPYQPLEDDESEGEILVGMGLYDPPEKDVEDPTLETYRNSVAHLLGSSYKYPESAGKGLKLEDAWEPPESDEDNEDSDERDGEADDGKTS